MDLRHVTAALALATLSTAAHAEGSAWNGTWLGLWEGKTPTTVTVAGDKIVEYRMQGRKIPVTNPKVENGTLSFGVELNQVKSTVVLKRADAKGDVKGDRKGEILADGEFMSPGGTTHEGHFAAAPAGKGTDGPGIDPTTTGKIDKTGPSPMAPVQPRR